MFKDKKVVVTGGSGFIGTHFIEELLDRGALVKTHTHESPLKIKDSRIEVLENINLEKLEDALILIEGADYVIHAAATKIVPTAEYNPIECVKTNIIGAMNLINACMESNVKKVIALSTDKAASPVNLYGATKLTFM